METQVKRDYSEVYGILNMLGENYINKIPKQLYALIENSRDTEYNPTYDANIAIESQNITNQSLAIIMLLHLNYWCETEEQKKQLKAVLEKNKIEVEEKYSIDNIFKQRIEQSNIQMEEINKQESQNQALIEYKEPLFAKIKRIIYNIFHKDKM